MFEWGLRYGPGTWDWIDGSMLTAPLPWEIEAVPPRRALQATDEDIARFFKYVDKLPNGCWFWTGARSRGKGNKKWYGSFYVNGTVVRAHRFSAEVIGKKGTLPAGAHRDHTCVFSLCVNFDHVEYVSHEENQRRKLVRRGS